jgi:uncharacterized membrane protein YeaQ/YmgE (transglycosylase-associated protein family)
MGSNKEGDTRCPLPVYLISGAKVHFFFHPKNLKQQFPKNSNIVKNKLISQTESNPFPMIWTLIIGGVAGWLAGRIMRGDGFGIIVDIIVGLIGGWIGGMVLGWFGVASGGSIIGRLIIALIGAIILIWIVRLIRRA